MGSRVGSFAILIVIIAIVAAVVVVINQLDLLNTGEPDAPVMVVSLEEGELVLLNEPQSITVTISSGNPIATLELIVDDAKVADVVPPYSQDRGAWIGAFVWTPQRLGFANVQIVALDADGVESVRQIRVEVTDDQARVAAALRITVLGIAPLQQFPAGTTILLAISATGSQPIERFDMLVNGQFVVAVTPKLDEATGRYAANIEWTPSQVGEIDVTLTAVDAAGRTESRTVPVILVPPGGSTDSEPSENQQAADSSASSSDAVDDPADEVGAALIDSPADGEQFQFDANFDLDVQLVATNVGTVESALLYITPIAPDNTLGNSVLIHSSEGHPPGDYRERVADVERFIASSGSYELQLVIFTPEQHRYDDRIVIHVVAVAATESDAESEDDSARTATSDEIDLAIVTARQTEDDRNRLNVSITNDSAIDIERTDVIVTVVDESTGAELAATTVTPGIDSGGLQTIPLELTLEPGQDTEALVILEADIDTNTGNNTFRVSLSAPEHEVEEEQQSAVGEQEQAEQSEQADPSDDQQEPESQASRPNPDLAFLDAQSTADGYVLLTVINNGDWPADTFSIVITNQAGEQLEVIGRRAADSDPLPPGGTEILTSLQPHSGAITITVQAGGGIAESNLDNNVLVLEIE